MAEPDDFDARLRDSLLAFGRRADRGFDASAIAAGAVAARRRPVAAVVLDRTWLGLGVPTYLPIVLLLALLLTLLASATISGGLRGLLPGPGELIVFTTADITREPAPSGMSPVRGWLSATDRTISAVRAHGGTPTTLGEVPGDPEPEVRLERDVVARVGPEPVWSPDGTKIAFRLTDMGGPIYVMDRNGGHLRMVAQTAGSAPYSEWLRISNIAWSPDGTRIAFITPHVSPFYTPTNGLLAVLDPNTGVVSNVGGGDVETPASGSLAWSPDGSRIAFARNLGLGGGLDHISSDIFIIGADGTGERQLRAGDGRVTHIGPMTWSPDGTEIAYEEEDIPGAAIHWYVIRDDGSMRREIDREQMEGCCIHSAYGGWLTWSPDGSLIAAPDRVMAADGSGEVFALDGLTIDWSPDGSQLVYSAPGPHLVLDSDVRRPAIYIVNADGTGATWLADGDYPTWSP
jgi:Tol biopolymer transport system component